MSAEKKDIGKGSEQTQLMLVSVLLTFAIIAKVWPKIYAFWIGHRITIVLTMWIGILSAVVFLIVWLWNLYVKKCHEESVIEEDGSAVYLGKEIK